MIDICIICDITCYIQYNIFLKMTVAERRHRFDYATSSSTVTQWEQSRRHETHWTEKRMWRRGAFIKVYDLYRQKTSVSINLMNSGVHYFYGGISAKTYNAENFHLCRPFQYGTNYLTKNWASKPTSMETCRYYALSNLEPIFWR